MHVWQEISKLYRHDTCLLLDRINLTIQCGECISYGYELPWGFIVKVSAGGRELPLPHGQLWNEFVIVVYLAIVVQEMLPTQTIPMRVNQFCVAQKNGRMNMELMQTPELYKTTL